MTDDASPARSPSLASRLRRLAATLLSPPSRGTADVAEQAAADPAQRDIAHALIAAMPDAAALLDRNGHVRHLNESAARLMPALREGEPAQFALRAPDVLTALREALAEGVTRRATFVDRGPVERWFELVITPVPGADVMMLLTFHDQTPLRRVEEMRADFIANASHELRTPLAALSGFIDTIQGPARNDSPARERFLGIMHTQAARMARLIDDLLSLSRVELAEHRTPTAILDLVPVLREVADGLEPLARERNVALTLTRPGTAMVAGDREELLRLFENLIENALKYGASGQRVDVSLAANDADDWIFAVRDHGPGIAPEHLPRLTERFYRVNAGDSRAQGGTGLGLALVKHIANRHRGRLSIQSRLGEGATFSVILPAVPDPAP